MRINRELSKSQKVKNKYSKMGFGLSRYIKAFHYSYKL